jgi:hypothetical protein
LDKNSQRQFIETGNEWLLDLDHSHVLNLWTFYKSGYMMLLAAVGKFIKPGATLANDGCRYSVTTLHILRQ